jgi:integrase
MMTETKFGCSYSEIWVSPVDWKTSKKKNLTVNWYVQCIFYDPTFKEKYPNGFQFRKRANKPRTLEGRQRLVLFLYNNMKKLLDSGFNPITKTFMGEVEVNQNIDEKTPFVDAIEFVFNKREDNDTKADLKSVIKYTILAIKNLHLDTLTISEVKRKHIKFILEYLSNNKVIEKKVKGQKVTYHTLTDKRRNKYINYLSGIFKDIIEYDAIENNPCHNIKKLSVINELRQVLTSEERKKVNDFLRENYRNFWLFTVIFFHSGGRMKELLSLKIKDIDLENQRYKTIIRKGGLNREVWKVIKTIALPYWEEVIGKTADAEAYIFHKGLAPQVSDKPINRDQITTRWRVHVKDKLGITADFYSLKHLNLDEVTEILSMEDAAKMASHTTTKMIEKNYAIGEKQRQLERLKHLQNEF